jgi:hypothetical protein
MKFFFVTFLTFISLSLHSQCSNDTVPLYRFKPDKYLAGRVLNKYDANGNNTETITQILDSNKYKNTFLEGFVYDKKNQLLSKWNAFGIVNSNDWYLYDKDSTEYDVLGNISREYFYGGVSSGSKWKLNFFTDFYYNNQNKLKESKSYNLNSLKIFTTIIRIDYDSSNLIKSIRYHSIDSNNIERLYAIDTLYSYNNKLISSKVHGILNSSTGVLEPKNKISTNYNTFNLEIEELHQNWDTITMKWTNFARYFTEYSPTNKVLNYQNQRWESIINKWGDLTKNTIFKYDNLDRLIEKYQFSIAATYEYYEYSADNKLSVYEINRINDAGPNNHYRLEYCNYTTANNDPIIYDSDVIIYPNPSFSGFVNINTQKQSNYKLIDLSGSIIQTGFFEEGTNTLNLKDYNSGILYLNIGNITKKIINLGR